MKDIEKATENLEELKTIWSDVMRVSTAVNSIYDYLQSDPETEDTMMPMALTSVSELIDSIAVKLHTNVKQLCENMEF